jgi:hypothetical protein
MFWCWTERERHSIAHNPTLHTQEAAQLDMASMVDVVRRSGYGWKFNMMISLPN